MLEKIWFSEVSLKLLVEMETKATTLEIIGHYLIKLNIHIPYDLAIIYTCIHTYIHRRSNTYAPSGGIYNNFSGVK